MEFCNLSFPNFSSSFCSPFPFQVTNLKWANILKSWFCSTQKLCSLLIHCCRQMCCVSHIVQPNNIRFCRHIPRDSSRFWRFLEIPKKSRGLLQKGASPWSLHTSLLQLLLCQCECLMTSGNDICKEWMWICPPFEALVGLYVHCPLPITFLSNFKCATYSLVQTSSDDIQRSCSFKSQRKS